jgi:hypothetical protein
VDRVAAMPDILDKVFKTLTVLFLPASICRFLPFDELISSLRLRPSRMYLSKLLYIAR